MTLTLPMWVQVAILIVSYFIAIILSTIITLIKRDKTKSKKEPNAQSNQATNRTFKEILNEKVIGYIEVAEELFKNVSKSGTALKLPYVLQQLTVDCLKENIEFNESEAKEKIEELIGLSKTINK